MARGVALVAITAMATGVCILLAGCEPIAAPHATSFHRSSARLGWGSSARPRSGVVLASWYGPGFNGRRTSSGEVYNQNALTAAARTIPLGSRVRVTNLSNGRSVNVRINDCGPYVKGRSLDLSRRAAERIGLTHGGVGMVKVTTLRSSTVSPYRCAIAGR
jgi:rare lipoprotein A (peptidoglycan hydrolase)